MLSLKRVNMEWSLILRWSVAVPLQIMKVEPLVSETEFANHIMTYLLLFFHLSENKYFVWHLLENKWVWLLWFFLSLVCQECARMKDVYRRAVGDDPQCLVLSGVCLVFWNRGGKDGYGLLITDWWCYFGEHRKMCKATEKPAPPRLLTEEEYRIQGEVETQKALQELREFCNSPECSAWKTISRIHSPKR